MARPPKAMARPFDRQNMSSTDHPTAPPVRPIYQGLRRWVRNANCFCLAVLTGATLCGFLGSLCWFFDLFAHFRLQYLFGFAVLCAAFSMQRRKAEAVFAGACLLLGSVSLLPYVLPNHAGHTTPTGSLLAFNVHTANEQKAEVLALITQTQPDVAALLEVDDIWMDALKALEPAYPHTVAEARPDNFGIAMYSKWPILDQHIHHFGPGELPTIEVTVQTPDGPLTIVATHPPPPAGREMTEMRNGQIRELTSHLRTSRASQPLIVAGDFNATPWSSVFARFKTIGLRESALGHGIHTTWMSSMPWLAIPIDHVLVSESIQIAEHRVLPACGSDHNAVFVRFSLAKIRE